MNERAVPNVKETSRVISAPGSGGVLQRRCACGQHTLSGQTCVHCHKQQSVQATDFSSRHTSVTDAPQHFSAADSKAEAVQDGPDPEDEGVKGENGAGAAVASAAGTAVSAVAGSAAGVAAGAAVGAAGSAVRAAGSAAATPLSYIGPAIEWKTANYSSNAAGGSSTTVEQPFDVQYFAIPDLLSFAWRMRVFPIKGGANIEVRTGGSRNPVSSPPTSQVEATNAVTTMQNYYTRGSRGAWHTENASKNHEMHHYREWKCSCEHYWPKTRTAIQQLSVPLSAHASPGAAVTAMRAGPSGADAKLKAFKDKAHDYWFTLADNASSRPYAAGQRALNPAILFAQGYSVLKGWSVPLGVSFPSPEPPCYQPWLPLALP